MDDFFKKVTRWIWSKELEELNYYISQKEYNKRIQDRNEELKAELDKVYSDNADLIKKYDNISRAFFQDVKQYNNWIIFEPELKTKYREIVHPSVFIQTNDRDLKSWLIRNKYHNYNIKETASKIEEMLHRHIKYISDYQNRIGLMEDFELSSVTWKYGKGDCDNYAILFQSCMEILGYGDKCVVKLDKVSVPKANFEGGHAYNKVLINDEWVVFDANFPYSYRDGNEKYDLKQKGLDFFFNSRAAYKDKENKI